MKFENLLLIIDMQNDFCSPTGALYVDGADRDVERLVHFIQTHKNSLDKIVLTQDAHQSFDISHPSFWISDTGESPAPFQVISSDDVKSGRWQAKKYHVEALEYITQLEQQNEFAHVIWPEHCIAGSKGAAISPRVMDAVAEWGRQGHVFDVVPKGSHPLTEHFGALQANIPIADVAATQMNQDLVDTLLQYNKIIVVGEAKSHCVAHTIKQLIEVEGLVSKVILLDDIMSNVTGFEDIALPIYKQAALAGVTTTTSVDIQL